MRPLNTTDPNDRALNTAVDKGVFVRGMGTNCTHSHDGGRPRLEVMELTGNRPLPRASEGTEEAKATRREIEVDAMFSGVA
jgi:hypothetical protein